MALLQPTIWKINKVIGEILETPPALIHANINFLHDTAMDSLGLIEMFMALEEKLFLDDIPQEVVEKIKTVGDIYVYCQAQI